MPTCIRYFLLLSPLVLAYVSCKNSFKGDLHPNIPPETFTVVDTIIRLGDNRFNSQVEVSWWGDDPDGYVAGYEYTFDSLISENTEWHFTIKQDSVFLLPTPPGQDTLDFKFHVRAIDNL